MIFSGTYRDKIRTAESKARKEIFLVISEYMPQIKESIERWEYLFNLWEHENCSEEHGRCASNWIIPAEKKAKERSRALYYEMEAKISKIENFKYFFGHKEIPANPCKLVENSEPGFLSAYNAIKYCEGMIERASSKSKK